MFYRFLYPIIFACLIVSSISEAQHASRYILANRVQKEVAPRASIIGEIDFRGNDNGFFRHHYDIGYAYNLNNETILTLKSRLVYLDNTHNWYLDEIRHQLQVLSFMEKRNWTLSGRFRHEFRVYQTPKFENINRSRFRFQASKNTVLNKITPFIRDEVFYEFERNRFSRNRLELGLTYTTDRHYAYRFFYRHQSEIPSDRISTWLFIDVFVFQCLMQF